MKFKSSAVCRNCQGLNNVDWIALIPTSPLRCIDRAGRFVQPRGSRQVCRLSNNQIQIFDGANVGAGSGNFVLAAPTLAPSKIWI